MRRTRRAGTHRHRLQFVKSAAMEHRVPATRARGGAKLVEWRGRAARLQGNGSGGTHRGSWLMESWRRAAAFRRRRRATARGSIYEEDDGPHPFNETRLITAANIPLETVNTPIVAAQVRSNGCEEPQGWTVFQLPSTPGHYFVARPRHGFSLVSRQARRRLHSCACTRSPCPCIRLAADGLGAALSSATCLHPIRLSGHRKVCRQRVAHRPTPSAMAGSS